MAIASKKTRFWYGIAVIAAVILGAWFLLPVLMAGSSSSGSGSGSGGVTDVDLQESFGGNATTDFQGPPPQASWWDW